MITGDSRRSVEAFQPYSAATLGRSRSKSMNPLSELAIIATPLPESANAVRKDWKPSFEPPWPNSSLPSSKEKPSPKPVDCFVSICFAIACDSTRVEVPALAFDTSMAMRARSEGVVHKPAGAISG